MKRIFTLLALAAFALTIFAQSPDLMTYQAVLRDAENHLLTNQAVAVQISVIQGAPNNAAVYMEVHSLSTNANGLVSLMIGDGISGDDFSLIDWSTGPFFLKTETDPDGGSNYTITTTSQLLSVPYAKYADQAGNIFSGQYADLTGAPTVVSAFVNDEGYLTGITGGETAFDGWDKNELDDFSGNYADLSGAPTVVSAFTNDAGYLTSELWSQNGSNLYYEGGNVGIGLSNPTRTLTVHSGALNNYATFQNNATGSLSNDGFIVGIETDLDGFVWNWEAGPIHFGTSNNFRMIIEAGGDVGIGTTNPTARLQVVGDTKFGASGVAFNEMREITGTTGATGNYTLISLPSGYDMGNTRVLSAEINFGSYAWAGTGSHYRTAAATLYNLSTFLSGSAVFLYYPNEPEYHSQNFRILIMQITP
jgi:hypothetical protein